MDLVTLEPIKWWLNGDSGNSLRHLHLELDANLKLPFTLSFASGSEVSQTLYFAVAPTLDPEVKVSGGWLDVDLGSCPWYVGLTPPPQGLKTDAAHASKETQARKDFLAKVLEGAGDDIRRVIDRLLRLPAEVFQALRTRVAEFLHNQVFGPFTRWLNIEQEVQTRIAQLLHAVEEMVRQAMSWLVSLARDVAKWLLTTADKVVTLTQSGCRSLVEAVQVLYQGVLDGASQLAELLKQALLTMAKDVARFAQQLCATIVALVQEGIAAAKDFAADLERYLAWALTELVKSAGMVEGKVKAFLEAVAKGIADGAAKVGIAAKEICNFFARLVESAVYGLSKIAEDPGVLYVWIGKLLRWGLEAYVAAAKLELEWLRWGAHVIGRGARALGACIGDFAKKSVAAVKPYAQAVLEALAALAKTLGKVSRQAFASFLQWIAGWSRTLFHAVCLVLRDAQDLLLALIGPEIIDDIKQALTFLCDFLEKVGDRVNQAIDALYHFGRFVAVDLPRDLAKVGSIVEKQIAGFASSLASMLENAFKTLVLKIGNHVRADPLVQAITTIVKAMLQLAEAAGVVIGDKAAELGDWLRPKIDEALARLDEMCQALTALMSGTGDGSVIEVRFRSLAMAKPRASKRSRAKVDILSELPVVHKLTGDDVLLPALQAIAGEMGLKLGALELFGYDNWRFSAPHPVTGTMELAREDTVKTRFLPVPISPEHDVVFRLCINPRLWVIDPRYSWGYGASNQLKLADIDGDGKVDEWEVRRTAQNRRAAKKADPDADPFTAEDLQTLLDQVENVLHGVPYRQIGAPFGLLAGYESGSWLWFSIASIGDEDVGAPKQGADPKATLGSVLRAGAAGTLIPSGQKVDRTGIGLFWQGMQRFGSGNYPVRYHIEKRIFWDQFASGFGNAGTSTFLVLRGGQAGNDFQLRGELYADFMGRGTLPIGMYTPTVRATFGFGAAGGAGGAAGGGVRLGLEYASSAPIAVLFGDEVKEEEKGKSVVDKVLEKLKADFKIDDIVPLLEKAVIPILRLVMFDQEFEAKLACAGAIAIGAELAIGKKKAWAQGSEGRLRTLHLLEQAETFLDDWKHSEEVRRQEADLREQTPAQSPKASEQLEERVKRLWAASKWNDEVRLDLTEIARLYRAFMRAAIKEPSSKDEGLEDRFAAWREGADPASRLAAYDKWLADQRKGHYYTAVGQAAETIKKLLWAGNFGGAWNKIKDGIHKIDATTGEYADEICETILAVAALIDIFHRMAVALANVKGLKKKITEDIDKRRKEKAKKASEPGDKRLPTILGRMGAEAHDDKWAQEILADAPAWGKESTGLADGLSLVWSIDGGLGLGAGGGGGGTGLGAFALAGLSVSPPCFKLPEELLKKLSSKLMLVRFGTKFLAALCEVIDYEVTFAHRPIPADSGELFQLAVAWCVQAVHQTLREVLTPGAAGTDPKLGQGPDPLEDWLFAFLSGSTISVGAKIEGLVKAVGTVLSAEARGSMGGELSVTLAALLDPLIEALQHHATRPPGDKARLGAHIVPKFSLKVKQTLTAGVALGPAQLDIGLTGQSLSADLLFPDGSPWRRKLEDRLEELVNRAVESAKERGAAMQAHKEEGRFLHGLTALCRAIEKILRNEMIPSVLDYEKKTGDEGPGTATALVTNPSVQRMFDVVRDPVAAGKKREEKQRRIDEIVDIIRKNELHFAAYPDQPDGCLRAKTTAANAFDVFVLLPDAEVAKFSPKTKFQLAQATYRIPLDPPPAHVALNTYRKKNDAKADPMSGIVVGFEKKTEAEAFAKQRDAAWVDSSVASIPPWPSPRAGESGTAQWYHWLNTQLFPAIEEARGKEQRIDQPKLAVDDQGVLLTFDLVARGLLDKAPFSSFGMKKKEEVLLTEAAILEGGWEDDVVRLRGEIRACQSRKGMPAPAAATGADSTSGSGSDAPAAGPAPDPAPAAEPAAAQTVRYQVKRAQVAVNHRLRGGGIPGWSKPLSTDGRFGPKTGAALDAWGKSLGAPPVQGQKGAHVVEIDPRLARALDDDHDSSVVACAPPHPIPEDDAPWMAVARREIGQKEIKGAEDNPRIREYHSATTLGEQADEVAWCSSFVNWCLKQAKIPRTRSAAAASWTDWGEETGARRGAVVVIYNAAAKNSGLTRTGNHVGFLVEDQGWGWKLLGGNQSNQVKESCFSKKKWTLKAMRWPSQE